MIYNYEDGEARIGCRLDEEAKCLVLRPEEDDVRVYGPYKKAMGETSDLMIFIETKIDEEVKESVRIGSGYLLRADGSISDRKNVGAKCLFIKPHLANLALEYVKIRWSSIRSRGLTGKVASELSKLVNEDYDDLTLEPHIGGKLSLNAILREGKVGIRLSDMGDGMRMLAVAMLLWELSEAKLLLWDDVEAFMSPSSLIYISGWMAELVERGSQVIVATHSREAAKLLVGMAEELGQEARVVLLALKNGILKSKALTLDKLEALEEAGVDVRMAEGFII